MGKKRKQEEGPPPSEEGNIGSLKASFVTDKRKKSAERKRRDRVKKERVSPKGAVVVNAEQTEDQSTVTGSAKKRRQPAESPDEKANKTLYNYVYNRLKALKKDAEITEQAVACLTDLIRNRAEATVKRAIHFSSGEKKRIVTYQSMWGAVRTLSSLPDITRVMLLSAATVISGVKNSQEQANAAWEAYSELPKDALEIVATQELLQGVTD